MTLIAHQGEVHAAAGTTVHTHDLIELAIVTIGFLIVIAFIIRERRRAK